MSERVQTTTTSPAATSPTAGGNPGGGQDAAPEHKAQLVQTQSLNEYLRDYSERMHT